MSTNDNKLDIFEICRSCRVLPILSVSEADLAVPLAQALLDGGIRVMEITLRTPAALDAIRKIREDVPKMIIGAGTLLTPQDVVKAIEAKAQFGVSPGVTSELLDAVDDTQLPFLPGVTTPTEMMYAMQRGYTIQKFFPAEITGGTDMLKAVAGPFPGLSFCPTGGIAREKVSQYLDLDNVICVGGSWVAPQDVIKLHQWDKITELAVIASGF